MIVFKPEMRSVLVTQVEDCCFILIASQYWDRDLTFSEARGQLMKLGLTADEADQLLTETKLIEYKIEGEKTNAIL
jgi:UPF0288 family protein (methanogenesis marker protein 3)